MHGRRFANYLTRPPKAAIAWKRTLQMRMGMMM